LVAVSVNPSTPGLIGHRAYCWPIGVKVPKLISIRRDLVIAKAVHRTSLDVVAGGAVIRDGGLCEKHRDIRGSVSAVGSATAVIFLNGSTVSGNSTNGFQILGSGVINSYGNNAITDTINSGSLTPVALQ
jgi:hypothetical protein